VEAQTPAVAGVAGAVAVTGEPGQIGPLGGGSGPPALDRGRVHHPGVVRPQVGVGGEHPDQHVELGFRRTNSPAGLSSPRGRRSRRPPQWLPGSRIRPFPTERLHRITFRHVPCPFDPWVPATARIGGHGGPTGGYLSAGHLDGPVPRLNAKSGITPIRDSRLGECHSEVLEPRN